MTLLKTVRNRIRTWLQSDEPAPNRGRARLSCENLEARENPSSIVYNAVNDTITVNGSPHDDHLVVETKQSGGFIQLPILKLTLTDSEGGIKNFSHSPLGGPVSKIVFNGFAGNDSNRHYVSIPLRAYGGSGDDFLVGGAGNDVLQGDAGVDRLFGLGGNDDLNGGSEGDYVYGGDGNDVLNGVGGDDYLYSSNGDDAIYGGTGNDRIYGLDGADRLFGGVGNDLLYGGNGPDFLQGEAGNDLLSGDGSNDRLSGGSGHDQLFGGSGRDALLGWSGDDYLVGGSGYDRYLRTPTLANNGNNTTISSAGDVSLNFRNGSQTQVNLAGKTYTVSGGSWSMDEIWNVDGALATMVDRTGDNVLLKRQDGDTIYLYRYGVMYDSTFQVSTTFSAWNSNNSYISLANNAFTSDAGLRSTIYHEIGHNWDNEWPTWNAFKQISGWSNVINAIAYPNQYALSLDGNWAYEKNSSFARDYGKTNPYEDFATCFERYFVDVEDGMSPTSGTSGDLLAKLNLIDTMLNAI